MRALAEIIAANNAAIRDTELRGEGEVQMVNHLIRTAERHIDELRDERAVTQDNIERHAAAGRTTLAGQGLAHANCITTQIETLKHTVAFIKKNAGDAIDA